ncbi:transposase [Acetobacter pasteurianus IFO 3283-22]|uniref:Transposase n=1 Tax=Acetobacter pasteurianus (strain NBRC 105184 / IFO 3283-01) TaxID=634452 RepID=C7JHX5_ACEP3|nr:transposase [Acetobacter pasteurianus IFO 3283-01]BAI02632.1 transposase [Acetobacter pasteurianus IFO 3283-03]BAI05678.1 transposase [Acetobacter pasteurianus IFO 3283-07]BAI08727.1 transposase [Acetobacter pasteurianus IFO 3283-22]BAI11775.1 transposase [Acetobacter pasteurianus IFO 3283-26]BAI14821.1 transposase [Acetobacter pasteurianus IFO 3283-32]BAI20851.1 transposase [Acetobacter pasteurianus IFO 3283-12]GCD65885.1 transposase [Acetobacter pasteurianus NBRC 3279]GCD72194.1 transp
MTGSMDDITALRAALAAAETRARAAETRATDAEARAVSAEAQITHLKHLIARMRQDRFGASSERGRRLLDQLELELEELETTQAEDAFENAADLAVCATAPRNNRGRQPLPADLPRERVVLPAPTQCPCCGGMRLSKLGESITETLEVIPRQFKVIQTVREKFTCRDCESITQPPAPFYPISRGRAGPELLAGILCDKYLQHLPLNRQSDAFAREGIDLDTSTLADWVGACTATLAPLNALIRVHVLAAGRLHADDTTVPVLAKGRTRTGRLWNYVRDDHPFGGTAPPAVWFRYSRDRKGEHPVDAEISQKGCTSG